MNLQRGAKRLLIVFAVLWGPFAVYWADHKAPAGVTTFDRQTELARDYLKAHPDQAGNWTPPSDQASTSSATDQQGGDENPPSGLLLGSNDKLPPAMTPAELDRAIAETEVIDQHPTLRVRAWFETHGTWVEIIAYSLFLPLLGAVILYFVGMPILTSMTSPSKHRR